MDNMPSKLEVFRALLLRGSVYVHLNPSRKGLFCDVPSYLQEKDSITLQVGLDMPVPIPDLSYTANCLRGTLSFNRKPYYVTIPWGAVYALVGDDAKGMVWNEDMPPSITDNERGGNVIPINSKAGLGTKSAKVKPKLGSDRSHLRLVK